MLTHCSFSTLLTSQKALDAHTALLAKYKRGEIPQMTPELWHAKKVVDATLHPDTGTPVFLPFRMSCFVFSNLVVTAGMLTPNLTTRGVLGWQIANQTLNVLINTSNANKSSPLSNGQLATSFLLAVGASCGVALGLGRVVQKVNFKPNAKMILGRLVPFAAVATAGVMNVCLMRGGEIKKGIDIYPTSDDGEKKKSLGKSQRAAVFAVGETAISRVLNATPIMVIPPLLLVRLTATEWLKSRPKLVMPINCGTLSSLLPHSIGSSSTVAVEFSSQARNQGSSLPPPSLPYP